MRERHIVAVHSKQPRESTNQVLLHTRRVRDRRLAVTRSRRPFTGLTNTGIIRLNIASRGTRRALGKWLRKLRGLAFAHTSSHSGTTRIRRVCDVGETPQGKAVLWGWCFPLPQAPRVDTEPPLEYTQCTVSFSL